MQILDGQLLLSATDLVNFLGCRHAAYLDLRDLTDPAPLPERDAATMLIFEKGIEHEKRYLASLKARGLAVVEIAPEGFDLVERSALARRTMRAGAAVIYQAALLAPPWHGYADFLERVAEPSSFGPWGYQAVDTKLGGRAKPEHAIQVAAYSKLLGIEQGRAPRHMHVMLGDNRRVSLRVSDFAHYHGVAQRRLEAFANRPPQSSVAEPCGHCRICRWQGRCEAEWEAADHLTLVANITRNQTRRLREAGIATVRALAALAAETRVPGIQPDTLGRLRASGRPASRQARHRRQPGRDAPARFGERFCQTGAPRSRRHLLRHRGSPVCRGRQPRIPFRARRRRRRRTPVHGFLGA